MACLGTGLLDGDLQPLRLRHGNSSRCSHEESGVLAQLPEVRFCAWDSQGASKEPFCRAPTFFLGARFVSPTVGRRPGFAHSSQDRMGLGRGVLHAPLQRHEMIWCTSLPRVHKVHAILDKSSSRSAAVLSRLSCLQFPRPDMRTMALPVSAAQDVASAVFCSHMSMCGLIPAGGPEASKNFARQPQ